jgi:hypothetical protein
MSEVTVYFGFSSFGGGGGGGGGPVVDKDE